MRPEQYDAEVHDDVRTLTDLVSWCENSLGWLPPQTDDPPYRVRQIEVGKLKRSMKKRKVDIDDLKLAAQWARRTKHHIDSPVGLVFLVDRARQRATVEQEFTDLGDQINRARGIEIGRIEDDPDAAQWASRFTRAAGEPAKRELLERWRAQGRDT